MKQKSDSTTIVSDTHSADLWIPHGLIIRPATPMREQSASLDDLRVPSRTYLRHGIQILCERPSDSVPVGWRDTVGRYFPEGTSDDGRFAGNFLTRQHLERWMELSENPVNAWKLKQGFYEGVGVLVVADGLASLASDADRVSANKAQVMGTKYSLTPDGVHELVISAILYKPL